MNNKRTLSALHILLASGLAFALPAVTQAKDTDVYLQSTGIVSSDAPNVLIILDNSGSMKDPTTALVPVPYDGTVTYTGSFDAAYIYWSTSGTAPTDPSTPNKFLATPSPGQNQCKDSLTTLANKGMYGGNVNVVGWIWDYVDPSTSTTTGRWKDLNGGTYPDGKLIMADVECSTDVANGTNPSKYLTDPTKPGASNLYTSRYTSNSNKSLSLSGFQKPTLYTGNYLNYLANPPMMTGSASKMSQAILAVQTIIDTNRGVRFGLVVFNENGSSGPDGGRVIYKIDNMDDARRAAMETVVGNIKALTWTPLAETMWEAYRYMSGGHVDFGNPSPAQTPAQDLCAQDTACATATGTYISPFTTACQKAYIILVTDGDPTNDDAANTKISGLTNTKASSAAKATLSYLDDLTEWMANNDVYSGLPDNQTVVTYTVGFGGGISATGEALLKSAAKLGGNAGKTAINEGYFTAGNAVDLTNALNSAISDALKETTSFTAPALSVNAFNTLYNRDDVYFAMFLPDTKLRWDGNVKKYSLCKDSSATATCKFGEIIDVNGAPAVDITTHRIKSTAVSYWGSVADGDQVNLGGAGAHLVTSSTRKIYTYTGGYGADNTSVTGATALPSGTGTGVDLTSTSNQVLTTNTALTAAMLGVAATDRDNTINWIRGLNVYNEGGAGTTVDRSWKYYDPVHSRPVIVNYGGTNAAPVMKIFVGTNDGMIHMINESTGVEEWAFLPPELLAMQDSLAKNTTGEHLWGMDSSPTFDIQDKSKDAAGNTVDRPDGIIDPTIGDYVHMYFSMRRGGRNIYALDVTPTTKLTSATATGGVDPKLMWVIHGGTSTGYSALAQTWSRPQVQTIRTGTGAGGSGANAESANTKVLMFGGGYDTANDMSIPAPSTNLGNAIFIADPLTGGRIWWASSNATADLSLSNMIYSIPSDLTLLDSNGDGAVDRIYAGDVGGQIWRIDLSPTLSTGKNGGSSGHVFADLACTSGSRPTCTGTPLQDRRRFFYPPDIAQVNDTIYGSPSNPKYDIVAIASGDREDPIDLLTSTQSPSQGPVHNRIYALRDYNIDAMGTGGSITYQATITDAVLYDATGNGLQNATTATIASSGIQTSSGWYINLIDSSGNWVGEKSMAKTEIFGGTLSVTTFTPASAATATLTCKPNDGLGQLYPLNILDGAASLDINGDGVIDSSDRQVSVGGGLPSEHVVVIREGGTSDLVGTSAPGAVNKQNQRAKTYWFQ